MTHDLKIWPEFYAPVSRGTKTFELRKDDRGYKEGDILTLREWDPRTQSYTGNRCERKVTYCLRHAPGLEQGFVILGLHWHISGRAH